MRRAILTACAPRIIAALANRARAARTFALLATAAALASLLATGPAAAQEEPAAEPAPATWGVSPSSQDGPDGRAAFDYALDPGETLIDFVGVSNFSTEPITLQLYASDAYTSESGAFDLLPSGEEPVDVGSWIGFNEQTVTIAPQTRLDVPFALTVPADATPGDHIGGIVAAVTESATDASGAEVLLERRVGARVHLRVSGELDPVLAPEMGHVTYHYGWNPVEPGSVSFDYEVENTGNVRLQGELVVRIGGPWDLLAQEVVIAELPQILPGDRFTGTAEIEDVWPLAYLNTELIVRPEAVDEADLASRLPSRTAEAGLWAPPWSQLAVALAFALLVWAVVKIRKRKRRKTTEGGSGRRTELDSGPDRRSESGPDPDPDPDTDPNPDPESAMSPTTVKEGSEA